MLAVALAAVAGLLLPGPSPRLSPRRRPRTARREQPRIWAAGLPVRARRAQDALRARRAQDALRAEISDLLPALAAELRGGADPRGAFAAAARDLPSFAPVAAAAGGTDGDIVAALRSVGARPGGGAAADLAVAWAVAERTGSALAEPVARLATGHRDSESVRREIVAQLAGPAATARLLAGLPAVGVAMGAAFGAQPWQFLLGAPAGRACLLLGVGLLVVGLRWTGRIARQAAAALP